MEDKKKKPEIKFTTLSVPDDKAFAETSLNDFEKFFINPSEAFMRKRLFINLYEDLDEVQDEENVVLNSLQSYILNNKLLKALSTCSMFLASIFFLSMSLYLSLNVSRILSIKS